MKIPIQAILVPQGPEYLAVRRGLSRAGYLLPVLPIPVGPAPVTQHLEKLQQAGFQPQSGILLMGLCGSLHPRYAIGDRVLYQDCLPGFQGSPPPVKSCDSELTSWLHQRLQFKVDLVKALTSDRLIHSAAEKRQLGQVSGADVVDMEGFAALSAFSQAGVAIAMLRVVSDGCHHNLPDLSSALSPEGSLQSLPLALGMLRQPIAATRLIRGSLRGLNVLRAVTTDLFTES